MPINKLNQLLAFDEMPTFWIIKPENYNCDKYCVFNYSAYPCSYYNDNFHELEIVYSYVLTCKVHDLKDILKIARKKQKELGSKKIYHIYHEDTQTYDLCYAGKFYHYEGDQ